MVCPNQDLLRSLVWSKNFRRDPLLLGLATAHLLFGSNLICYVKLPEGNGGRVFMYLVGGDWNIIFIFPCIGNNHPN